MPPYKRILLKNQIKVSHLTAIPLSQNRHLTLVGTFFSQINAYKVHVHIFKDYRKAFDEKRNRNRSQINELIEQYLVVKNKNFNFIKTKMVPAAMKIIWAQKWNQLTSCSKINIMCVLVTLLKHLKGKYKKTLC